MSSIEDRIRGLFARACDPGTTEEEARTSAVLLCRLAKKHALDLFVASPKDDALAARLAPEEVIALVGLERSRGEARVMQLRAKHSAELERARHVAYHEGQRAALAERHHVDPPGIPMRTGALVYLPEFAETRWSDVAVYLATRRPGTQLELQRRDMPHPADEGAERSIGMPHGQARDWRFPPDEHGRGLHVHEHRRTWIAHLDERHPSVDLWGHLRRDVFG